MESSIPAGIRMTKVGLWFVLFALLVGAAATNTGNNALYMVLASMLALLVVSGLLSRANLRRLDLEVEPPDEIFANTPFRVRFLLTNRGRFLPRWLLLVSLRQEVPPVLVPHLPRFREQPARHEGEVELLVRRRGRHRLESVRLWSLFPFGFFRKGMRRRLDLEMLVYPEIFSAASCQLDQPGRFGEESRRRAGWGHELHAFRGFRAGDDPRSIHWKQTARTGSMVFMERQAEESRRLQILIDNAVGKLTNATVEARFERLVSEAATAALDHLERGFEVELVTRDRVVGFASGRGQRRRILEALALLETRPPVVEPLAGTTSDAPQLRLVLDPQLSGSPPAAAGGAA